MKRFIAFIGLLLCTVSGFAQPAFKGGQQALANFLKEHIVYPDFSAKNCIGGTIRVHFRVDKNGHVDQVKTVSGLEIDLDDEAVRVVKMSSGNWELPQGITYANFTLPIRFTPDPSHCTMATKMSRDQAISAYHVRQEQENVITNYYENKYLGKADTTKESYIVALKKQLGFDDEFIEDVLKQADDKLKQGDAEGACTTWKFIRNIGSNKADRFIAQFCK